MGVHLRLEAHVLALQVEVLQRVAERQQDAVGIKRLFEEVVRAELRGFDGGLDRAVSGDHHHLGVGIELAQLAQRLEAVHPLHLHIQEDEVRPELGVEPQRLPPRRAGLHFDLFELEHLLQRFADALFVVDHQHAAAHGFRRAVRYSTIPVG